MPSGNQKLHSDGVIATSGSDALMKTMCLVDAGPVQFDAETGALRNIVAPPVMRNGSHVNRCPSSQIQCVSTTVTVPSAAAATWVNIASEISK